MGFELGRALSGAPELSQKSSARGEAHNDGSRLGEAKDWRAIPTMVMHASSHLSLYTVPVVASLGLGVNGAAAASAAPAAAAQARRSSRSSAA